MQHCNGQSSSISSLRQKTSESDEDLLKNIQFNKSTLDTNGFFSSNVSQHYFLNESATLFF